MDVGNVKARRERAWPLFRPPRLRYSKVSLCLKKMNYCLHITHAPYTSQTAMTALLFAQKLLERQHTILRIFFSGDGVHNGNGLCIVPQDEMNIPLAWQKIAQEHGIELIVCVSSALKRGIINEQEAQRYEKPQHNLLSGFEISGLGQLIEASIHADRLVTF